MNGWSPTNDNASGENSIVVPVVVYNETSSPLIVYSKAPHAPIESVAALKLKVLVLHTSVGVGSFAKVGELSVAPKQ